ncbi:hypothetical protein A9W99_07035 [Mycobacterium sp. 1164966.3]|uniref:PE family protein n=1 Tax=Mycobacterium sp. 1164966.3 TaxID=1856861 RepID=UPI0007FBA423|nr:hypothetical protein A9W99_07035 [Mycobacterium sp. 1164966.3]
MSFLTAVPQPIADAATNLADIGSTISQANTAASAATTGVVPAGADEVSQAIATLFAGHGQAYQSLSSQAALFHDQFVRLLSSGAASYAGAEAANTVPLQAMSVVPPA